jgi:membrane protein EpsK
VQTSFQIAVNTLTSWGCSLLSGILGWVLVPIYIAQLGKEGYGLIGLATTIVVYTMIVDLGLQQALGRQLAAEVARKDVDAFNRLASSAMVFYLCLSVVPSLVLVVTAPSLAGIFAVSPASRSEAVFLIRWYAPLATVLTLIGSVYAATLTSGNRFDRLNIVTSGNYALRAVLLVAVLKLTHLGVRGWAIVTIATELIRLVLLRFSAVRIRPSFQLRIRLFRLGSIRSLVGLGIYSFGAESARLLSAQSDPLILSLYFGPAILALYSPAVQLLNAIKPFVYAIASQLCPIATNFHVTNNRDKVAEVLTSGTRYQLLQGAGAMALVIAFANSVIQVWLGKTLRGDCRTTAGVLMALSVVDVINYSAGTQWPVLLGMGRPKVFVVTAVPLGIAYITTSFVLVAHTSLGIYGVLVPNLVFTLIIRILIGAHAAKLCGLLPREYLVASYIRPTLVFALLLGFCVALSRAVVPSSYGGLAGCSALALIVWCGLCWFVGFSEKDRWRLKGILLHAWYSLKNTGRSAASAAEAATTEASKGA